jgi:hypothetical protein
VTSLIGLSRRPISIRSSSDFYNDHIMIQSARSRMNSYKHGEVREDSVGKERTGLQSHRNFGGRSSKNGRQNEGKG